MTIIKTVALTHLIQLWLLHQIQIVHRPDPKIGSLREILLPRHRLLLLLLRPATSLRLHATFTPSQVVLDTAVLGHLQHLSALPLSPEVLVDGSR